MNGNEQAVIAAFINGQEQHLIPSIPVAYFTSQEGQDIFRVIKDLHKKMMPVDYYTVAQDKRVCGSRLAEISGASLIMPTVDKHINELRKGYLRRSLKMKIVVANKLIDDEAEIPDILAALRLDEADAIQKTARIYNPVEQTEAYYNHVRAVSTNVLKTGIGPIDGILHGVAPGQVFTFLGRAGCFKTSYLQYCLHNYSLHSGKIAAMFSLEMPVESIVERNLQMLKGWTCTTTENHFSISSKCPETMTEYTAAFENFAVVDGRVSLDEIPAYLRLINKKWHGRSVGAIGIDYMGLIGGYETDKEYEKVSKIAREIKQLAKDIHMPVVVLAQTNRTQADGTQEIFLHQGRGSGAIEEAADYILGAFKSDESDTAKLVFKVLKNRRGPTGKMFEIDMNPNTFQYTGTATEYEPPKKNDHKQMQG